MGIPADETVGLTVGMVVRVNFPYADFSRFKQRPALIVGLAEFSNLILCQITSQKFTSTKAIGLWRSDFRTGGLRVRSYIRPDKLVTLESYLVLDTLGQLTPRKKSQVIIAVRELFEEN